MSHNFENLNTEIAAQDSDLTALLELEIFDETSAVSSGRADLLEIINDDEIRELRRNIKQTYHLGEPEFKRALLKCTAGIIEGRTGVKTRLGREFFNGTV